MKDLLKKEVIVLPVFIYNFLSILIFLLSHTYTLIQVQAILVFFGYVLIPMTIAIRNPKFEKDGSYLIPTDIHNVLIGLNYFIFLIINSLIFLFVLSYLK